MPSKKKMTTLHDLLLHELMDLLDAEERILKALPKMAKAASSRELREAFDEHLLQTEGHVERLRKVFRLLRKPAKRQRCDGMKGLIEEGAKAMKEPMDDEVRDAALIAAAQRVEHYEIAGYGTARTFARMLGKDEAAELLQETLDEEGETDHLLTEIAETMVNPAAR